MSRGGDKKAKVTRPYGGTNSAKNKLSRSGLKGRNEGQKTLVFFGRDGFQCLGGKIGGSEGLQNLARKPGAWGKGGGE